MILQIIVGYHEILQILQDYHTKPKYTISVYKVIILFQSCN